MNPIRVGIAGFGASAQIFHIPLLQALNQDFLITAVVDRRGTEAPKILPKARIHKDIESLAQDTSVDLVVLCLPNPLHAQAGELLLNAGKHVVVEKPMAVTSAEGERMIRAANKNGKLLTVFHNRRLDGDFLTVKSLLENETLGRLVRAEIRFDRWSNKLRKKAWKENNLPGCTLLDDLGSHLIDQALKLFGDPAEVTCRQSIQRDESTTVDHFRVTLDYPQFYVDLEAGMLVRQPPFHWALYGTKGTFLKSGLDPQEGLLNQGINPLSKDFGLEPASHSGLLYSETDKPTQLNTQAGRYIDFYINLAQAVRGEKDLLVSPQEGLKVLKILELCRSSQGSVKKL